MELFTKQSLIAKLKAIREQGWIQSTRSSKNDGAIGNTLEDLLGIKENNLPLPNAAEWEIKAQRVGNKSLTTLCHLEPSPQALKLVSRLLLPQYGWAHKKAGTAYPITERSFRQTIHAHGYSDRGFTVQIDPALQRIAVSFNYTQVAPRHAVWLREVEQQVGLGELDPQPYWGFHDLEHKLGAKLCNMFYAEAAVRRVQGVHQFWYKRFLILQDFALERFLAGLQAGVVYVDFDARTGHNHSTKFRVRANSLPQLYATIHDIDTL